MKWPKQKIVAFCQTGSGGTPSRKKAEYYGGSIPWVKSGELKNDVIIETEEFITEKGLRESSAKLIPKNSILVAMYGATVGKTALLGIEATTNQAICNIQPDPKLAHYKYVQHYLNRSINELLHKRVGGAQPNISQQIIKNIEIPLPPPSEQRRIVEILDQADLLRKLRAEADKKAECILPALFIKMFGDPATNPMGWETGTLGEVVIDLRYGTSERCGSEVHGLPVLRIPNVLSGQVIIDDLKFANLSIAQSKSLLLEKGDILFVRTNGNRNYVGRCAVFDLSGKYLYASYLIRARLNQHQVLPKFLTSIFNSPIGRQSMEAFIRTTAGQSNISQEGLRQIPIIIPPLPRQLDFCRRSEGIERDRSQRRACNDKIEILFNALLHRAFTGDLTAAWRQEHMKELLQEMELQAKALNN